MSCVAIILARGGSKRLANKNLLTIKGKTLVDYSIEHAQKSELFSKIILSSDSLDILQSGINAKIDVRHRPDFLASDGATSFDAVLDVIDSYRLGSNGENRFVLLQPVSPIRAYDTLLESIQLLNDPSVDSVASYELVDMGHPYRLKQIADNGETSSFLPESQDMGPRSSLPSVYKRDGLIYGFKSTVLTSGSLVGGAHYGVVSDPIYTVNVDTRKDFVLAEALLNELGTSFIGIDN